MTIPTDTLFGNQWYLLNTGQFGGTPGIDINVTSVWDDYDGSGVHVGVYDDGIEFTHLDLNDNYDASRHVIINGLAHNPFPSFSADSHGTSVAGVIAAENDGVGTVGVANGASLTGVNIFSLFSLSFDQGEQALVQQGNFDIFNNSWGLNTPFAENVLDPALATIVAGFNNALQNGRGGLGTVIVKAAGNDRTDQFNSGVARDTNDSNFTNSPGIITVAAVNNFGIVSEYSTPGATVLVSAPSSGGSQGIWTTDRTGTAGANSGFDAFTSDNGFPNYDGSFGGTSAASPMVAGIAALMLDANPNLGWRDVQEILSYSARHVGSTIGTGHFAGIELYDWSFNHASNWNGGGLHFSNDYGFGLVDALAAVRLAETWTQTSTSSNEAVVSSFNGTNKAIPDNNLTGITYAFSVSTNIDVEQIEIGLDMLSAHTFVGDLIVTLTSPTGTTSTLLNRLGQVHGTGNGLDFTLDDWLLRSNAFRGEMSAGTWTLRIVDAASGDVGTVDAVTLSVAGSSNTSADTYIYTNEYSDYDGLFGHSTTVADTDGGIDTINAAGVTSGSAINLNAVTTSTIDGASLVIAAGTVIENAYGGDGNDTLTGNSAANQLRGGRGNDTLVGGAGADTLDGGTGTDTLTDRGGTAGVTINLATGVATDGFGNIDTLISFENAIGTGFADTLISDGGDNTLQGSAGNDTLVGGAGADTLDGGTGEDTIIVGGGNAGATVNLATGIATDGFGNTDALISIENAIGTGFADTLIGDGGNNTLRGGAGGDSLIGGLGGDRLDGGDSFGVAAHGGSVLRLYQATLDRLPDVSGYNFWVSHLDGGTPLSSITTGFINSPEFQQTYGSLDNSQFVTLLYNNVLDRAPDAGGLAFWVNTLNGGASRESVVNGFSESPEFQVNTEFAALAFATTQLNGLDFGQVFRVYQATLDRAPDADGIEFWTNALAGGVSLEAMTTGFVNSPEFQQTYGSLDNSQFVTLLYNNVLDRAPDAGGLAFWGGVLNGGSSRASVVLGFSESPEFITNTDAALKSFLQTGVPNWADVLTGGAGDDQMVGGRGSDAFVFNASDAGADHVYGLEVWDKLQLTGFGYATDADARAHMSQLDKDVTFDDQGVSITLHNTSLATLDQVWLVV